MIKAINENQEKVIDFLDKDEVKKSKDSYAQCLVGILKANQLECDKLVDKRKQIAREFKGYKQKNKKRPKDENEQNWTWKKLVERCSYLKNKQDKTYVEYRLFLILSLTTKICPARSEWFYKLAWNKDKPNFIDLENKKLHYTYFKTSDSLGAIDYDLSDDLIKILREWKKSHMPKSVYLFGDNVKSNHFTNWLSRDKGKLGISTTAIRNLWKADIEPTLTLEQKEKYARMMQHSVSTQATIYGYK